MTQTQPEPKFAPDQNVCFKITVTMSAVIDGEAEWDEEEGEYIYQVKNAKFLDCPEDIYLEETSLLIDEQASIFPEDKLLTLHKLVVKKNAERLPPCGQGTPLTDSMKQALVNNGATL